MINISGILLIMTIITIIATNTTTVAVKMMIASFVTAIVKAKQ